MTVVVLAAAAAALCWPARLSIGARLREMTRSTADPTTNAEGVRRPLIIFAVVAIAGLLLLGGPWWLTMLLAVAAVVGSRTRPPVGPGSDEVPLLADLMAACLSAGARPADALAASSVAAGPWLGDRCGVVVRALSAGAPAADAWAEWLHDDRLAPIARTCIRTAGSGAAAAAELIRVAARLRASRRAIGQQRVARAAVWIVLPLGVCFLPAFVAVGVVPLVVSLIARLH